MVEMSGAGWASACTPSVGESLWRLRSSLLPSNAGPWPRLAISSGATAAFDQFHGNSSGTRDTGMLGIRAKTSTSHAWGSMSFIFAVTLNEYMKAARSLPC